MADPAGAETSEATRVDKWLWAVRLFKTRTAAAEACRGGRVKVNRVAAKPATHVKPGDTVSAQSGGRERVVEVVRLVGKRVGAPVAAACYEDHSPPPETDAAAFARDRGSGRPTKRERRQLDRLRHR
ncbi:MAG TPA: RNA-binding S4 domain-containing protein [Acidimicrobiales bacterium]|nr:RNA-binding S4 domain-containing protein [Acidimicrobiales bacterium]